MPPIHQPTPPGHDYVVPAPRATDAIGAALRGAYDRQMAVPASLAGMLAALDRTGRP
jgi:hypothetical protein